MLSKKIRKLVNNPALFFGDFFKKHMGKKSSKGIKYSIAVVSTDAEQLKECIASFREVPPALKDKLEIIVLPVGEVAVDVPLSAAGSVRIVTAKTRFDTKPGAYNAAIDIATGVYIKFIDDGVRLPASFFADIDRVVLKAGTPPFVVLNDVFYVSENGDLAADTASNALITGDKRIKIADTSTAVPLSLQAMSFSLAMVKASDILFDEAMHQELVGADFCSRYLGYAAPRGTEIAHVRRAHAHCASMPLLPKDLPAQLLDPAFDAAYLQITLRALEHVEEKKSQDFLKNTHFNFLLRLVDALVSKRKIDERLDADQKHAIVQNIRHVLVLFGETYLNKYNGPGFKFFHRMGMLNLAGFPFGGAQILYVEDYNAQEKAIRVKYFASNIGFEQFAAGGASIIPGHIKTRHYSILGAPFCEERIAWLHTNAVPSAAITAQIGAAPRVRLSLGGKTHDVCRLSQIEAYFGANAAVLATLPLKVKVLRRLARLAFVRRRYQGAWLVTDNDIKADDNGEHFYRYLLQRQPDTLSYFLINKDTSDWKRLKAEGFKLIPFGGLRHRLALLNCSFLISSHANPAIVNFLPKKHFSDMLNYEFVFLQHGVTKDDQSEWLNSRNIRLLVTAAVPEYEDIAGYGRYKYTDREVLLSGFPRHDSLVNAAPSEKLVLIMPTWRKSLSGPLQKKSSKRQKNPYFSESAFCNRWRTLISSPKLREYCETHGYRLAFFPHPNIMDYMDDLQLPDYVEMYRMGEHSIQDLFQRSAMIVTDFSSVAFELAYMMKPVVYFQFDIDEFFAEHSYSRGYYDYEKDGFGPVCYSEETATDEIGALIAQNCVASPMYAERMQKFFPYRDGKCSERTFRAIHALTEPRRHKKISPDIVFSYAEAATQGGHWALAVERWKQAYEHGDEGRRELAAIYLAQALRQVGQTEAALQTLDAIGAEQGDYLALRSREHAELRSAERQWDQAVVAWQQHLSRYPSDGDQTRAYVKLAEAYRQQNKMTEAVDALDACGDACRLAFAFRLEHAYLQNSLGNWDAAVREWLLLAEEADLAEDDLLAAVDALFQVRLLDEATKILQAILNKTPANTNALRKLATIECEQKAWGAAEKRLLALEAAEGATMPVQDALWLAQVQTNKQNYKAAEARYKAIFQVEPTNAETVAGLTRVYYHQKLWSKVILFLSSVEQEMLDTDDVRLYLSVAYLETGHVEQAARILGAYLDRHPSSVDACVVKARIASAQKDWAVAASLWQTLIIYHRDIVPGDAVLMLVKALHAQGRVQEAQEVLYKEAIHQCYAGLEREPTNSRLLADCAELFGKTHLLPKRMEMDTASQKANVVGI